MIPLSEGDYSVKAYNYEGENVTVSERPFFKGEQTFSVKKVYLPAWICRANWHVLRSNWA